MKFKIPYYCFFLLLFNNIAFTNLIRPADGKELSYIHIFFEWEQQPDAIGYNLQASTQQFFNNLIIDVDEPTTVYIDKDSFSWNDNYYWRVRPIYSDGNSGDWTELSEFSIEQTALLSLDVDVYNDDLIQDGLIMYSQFLPEVAVGVIDKFGNEIWNTDAVFMNHINSYGQLYGVNGPGVQFNYDEDILFETSDNNVDMHEVKQIPNGNYMGWVPTFQNGPIPQGDWTFLFQLQGYNADGFTNEFPWMGMRIVEWDFETGQEIWSWDPFLHFSMDDHDLYGDIWWGAYFDGVFDWMHTNAFHFDAEESVIYVSHRHLSRISKIAYPSGNVVWNIGMPSQYNTGSNNICIDLGNSFQHNIQLLDDGSLLFFDNGNLSEMLMDDSNPTSRIRRIRVIDDSYCETVWQYDLPPNLFGVGMGSVQLLKNGNYSIYTYGNGLDQGECSIFEITPDGDMVWKVTAENQNAAWYRSYKVPSIHPNAFSVVAGGYTENEGENIIELTSNSLDFTIYNKSGYSHKYKYTLSDLMDGGAQLFNYDEGMVSIEPYESAELSFSVNSVATYTATQVMLNIWPGHHEYAVKELVFSVTLGSALNGDINADGVVNILDVVLLVNMVLSVEFEASADLNSDGVINVLDVVGLVNTILNN